MKKTKLLSLVAASTVVFAMSGCQKAKPTDLLKTTYGTDPSTWNAITVNDQPSSMHLTNFVDGLVENNNRGALVPGLATAWAASALTGEDAGKQKWTFNLRADVKWRIVQAGQLVDFTVGGVQQYVTAQDWVTTGKYILDPQNASEVVYLWWMFIDGAQDYYEELNFAQVCNSTSSTTQKGLATRYEMECDTIGVGEAQENAIEITTPDDEATTDVDETVYAYKAGGVAKVDNVLPVFEDMVGIRQGANAQTLEFVLPKEMNYFPTVLTYSAYLPTSQAFLNSIGGIANYGVIDTNPADNLAYNGAYYLHSYAAQSQIIYKANPSYYDAANVFIKEVRFLYVPDGASQSWAREQYEGGNIDGFRVTPQDVAGWSKYVTGKSGTGTETNPAHNNAYSVSANGNGSVYMLRWNYDRPDKDDPFGDSTRAEIENFELALRNANFRKALFYAVDRNAYNSRYTTNPSQWTYTGFIPNGLVYDQDGKDYTQYFREKVAEKIGTELTGFTPAVVPATFAQGVGAQTQASVYNPAIAKFYMQKALTDWGYGTMASPGARPSNDVPSLPIKFEAIFNSNANLQGTYNAFIGSINESINLAYNEAVAPTYGAHVADAPLVYAAVFTAAGSLVSQNAFYGDGFSAYISGWGPDYGDPTTFTNTMKPNGDLSHSIGLTSRDALPGYGTYADLNAAADEYSVLADRYEAFAEAEFNLLFEQALLVPLFQPYQGTDVRVGRIQPFLVQKAIYGNSADKLKGIKLLAKPLTKETYAEFKAAYDAAAD